MKKTLINLTSKFKTFGLITLLMVGLSTFQSCNKEGCTDSTANNFDDKADEDDNSCTFDRDAFIGNYNNSTDNCISGQSFNMTITRGVAATNQISISNFGGFGTSVNVTAIVSGSTVTLQSGTLGSGLSLLSGTGAINSNLLTINYTYDEVGGSQESCTINATRSN